MNMHDVEWVDEYMCVNVYIVKRRKYSLPAAVKERRHSVQKTSKS